jgi:hypothetical protein
MTIFIVSGTGWNTRFTREMASLFSRSRTCGPGRTLLQFDAALFQKSAHLVRVFRCAVKDHVKSGGRIVIQPERGCALQDIPEIREQC